MKRFIVLIMISVVLFSFFPAASPVAAESIDVRLARMEEKLDYLVEQNKARDADYEKMDLRMTKVEQKVEKHSFWFSIFGWVGGAAWAIILLLLGTVFRKWFDKKPERSLPMCEEGGQ